MPRGVIEAAKLKTIHVLRKFLVETGKSIVVNIDCVGQDVRVVVLFHGTSFVTFFVPW